tara:strand:+ start:1304 stop:1498 length:195 start_codon:yes stop_codon:yes gene_type:complete
LFIASKFFIPKNKYFIGRILAYTNKTSAERHQFDEIKPASVLPKKWLYEKSQSHLKLYVYATLV